MNLAEMLEKLKTLPEDKQAEVVDYVEFPADRFGRRRSVDDWARQQFEDYSLTEALRGMEDDPTVYGDGDLRERWS